MFNSGTSYGSSISQSKNSIVSLVFFLATTQIFGEDAARDAASHEVIAYFEDNYMRIATRDAVELAHVCVAYERDEMVWRFLARLNDPERIALADTGRMVRDDDRPQPSDHALRALRPEAPAGVMPASPNKGMPAP